MSFAPEPARPHDQAELTAVLLCNLGTPDAPTPSAVRRFLAEFLGDPRVVEIPRPLWWLILHGVILRVRPRQSAARYASIWTPEGSPLTTWTQVLTKRLAGNLGERGHRVTVRSAMRYGAPSIPQVLDELKAAGATRVLVLPLYPQYAASTTASVVDAVLGWSRRIRALPEFRFVNRFHDDPGYIAAVARRIADHWAANGRADKLVMSFHGIPKRSLTLGDPYHCECLKTARLVSEQLGISANDYLVTFQSRLGRAEWLQPYTEPTLVTLAHQGVHRVDVVCPGFTSDNLETLEEIDQEARTAFLKAGGTEFRYIPCLNDQTDWVRALTALAERHLQGWDTRGGPDARELALRRQRAVDGGAKA
ncbi:ferrochelatase [Rhizobacter sp. Root1221]|uniref:ferrochelatase n=1 Tax=Rhizobacter sp. Root1221 TaxID=1736433 RepID=UPI0006FE1C97|nr:ferrochelatase [Rhizobacter sp. Root1221]KQW02997.1 ferrochelatase [Rhizobacter sp. Root1221]